MNSLDEIQHKDGVPWHEAPAPPKRHKHVAQTYGWVRLNYVERCACGAFGPSRLGGRWVLLDPPRVAKRWWRR